VTSSRLKRAKRRVRREVLAARDGIPPSERRARGKLVAERFLTLPEVERAGTVMLFWSFGSEVPTAKIIERLHARGAVVALPRIEGSELVPVGYGPGDLTETTAFGAEEPLRGARIAPAALDVVAVPAVAFDRRGGRIGYGGGYYDRLLRGLRAFTVGLAFGVQVLEEELPTGNFDRHVDAIVTESETIRPPDLNSRSGSW
jgi:5-formyltetrahydrofolate cyclo-ligase